MYFYFYLLFTFSFLCIGHERHHLEIMYSDTQEGQEITKKLKRPEEPPIFMNNNITQTL